MFKSVFNKAFLSTLAAAIVATGLSMNPAMARGAGGDGAGPDRGKFSAETQQEAASRDADAEDEADTAGPNSRVIPLQASQGLQ